MTIAQTPTPRVAIVTGASSGIGAACATGLAAAGFKVTLAARRVAELQTVARACEAAGGEALVAATDVTDRASVAAMVERTVARWGRLDVLIAAAGTTVVESEYAEVTEANFKQVWSVNVDGVFYATRACLEPMKRSGGGLMVLISSMVARRPSTVGGPAYVGSKHAVNGIGETLAAEEQGAGIRVTVLSPGAVNTPIQQVRRNPASAEHLASVTQPEDIAELCLLLARLPTRVTIPVIDVMPTRGPARRA